MNTDSYFSLTLISAASITAALNTLIYTTVQAPIDDLLGLTLIDEFLEDPTFPLTLHDRRFAVCCILVKHITAHWHYLSGVFHLGLSQENESYETALTAIIEYGKIQNPEVTGWCWLYYRYVRPELNIQENIFCKVCHISDRTLRRYQVHAVQRLTDMVIQSEWELRRKRYIASRTDLVS